MRIGIVTQRLGSNYGGILQNYALQYVLKQLGHQPVTFDIGARNWSRWFLECIKTWIKLMIARPTLPVPLSPYAVYRRERALRRFVKKYISITSPIWHIKPEDIQRYRIEGLVMGSDQIWRPMWSNVPEAFGEFAFEKDIPKIAYAASFGVDYWTFDHDLQNKCANLIQKFRAISVRESSGVLLCEKYLGCKCVQMPDPTLLVEHSVYLSLCKDVPCKKGNYLFAYILDASEAIMNVIKDIALENGLDIIVKQADGNISDTDSVEKWLSCFRDSSMVITDSFHGTVFSIIFYKEFYVLQNAERGNTRIDSLLHTFGFKDRILRPDQPLENSPIDWELINKIITEERNRGIDFLAKYLSE